ncbi:MAG: hypothetical protein WCD12_08850 [Candidatus Binatus sp.]|uniref:hypothetical protein n=1 Tax=Candidatus Binatus sp. TaxID=2811406 RepID=UPI003C730331
MAITAILLVGCATGTPESSRAANRLSIEKAEQRIGQNEDKCIEEAAMRCGAQLSNAVMTRGALTQLEIQALFLQRDEAVSQCLANADEVRETIAARERTLYENAEALDRKVPLPILTMSLSP